MRRKILLLLTVLMLMIPCFASESVNAFIFPLNSSIYRDIDNLYVLNGLARPSTIRPWSGSQVQIILNRIKYSDQTDACKTLYNKVEDALNKGLRWKFDDGFQASVGIDFGVEMYAHSNCRDFAKETDWERSYAQRKSLMRIYFDFAVSDFFYTTSDIHYKWARADYHDHFENYIGSDKLSSDGYIASYNLEDQSSSDIFSYVAKSHFFSQKFATSVFTDTMNFSFIWPKQAVISVGGDNWNISLNRDILNIGNAEFGNLLVDGHDFSDFARFSAFTKNFNYDFILVFLNTLLSDNEKTESREGRIFMIHTLQFRLLDKISLTVSENVIYKYSNLNPLYINPSFIYHNLNNRSMFNALAYLELNATLFKGFELYAQYALDQARAPHEGDSQSDASGLVIGSRYTNILSNGILKSNAEFALTTPLLYRRDIVDFVRVNRYWTHSALDDSFGGGHVPFFDYIGFPYGGDTMLIQISADYSSFDNYSLRSFARFVQKGSMNIFKSHNINGYNENEPNFKGKTPTGDFVKQFLVIGIKGNADFEKIFSWPGISFGGELDFVARWNKNKEVNTVTNFQYDLQFTLGFTAAL